MVESASYLGSYSSYPLLFAINSQNSTIQSNEKTQENNSPEGVFSQIIDEMNANIENNLKQSTDDNTLTSNSISDEQFGPPAGMNISGLDMADFSIDTQTSENISGENSIDNADFGEKVSQNSDLSSASGENENNEDKEDNPMDTNKDGIVSLKEMITYFGIKQYDETATNTATMQNDDIFDLMV